MSHNGILLRIKGKVQGVGFRPVVWQLAHELGLTGDVSNNGAGVEVRLWGDEAGTFIHRLRQACPPLAAIHSIETLPWQWELPPRDFTILASGGGGMSTQVVPDAATCDACLAELNDPANRRFAYPFINCTHCGPRFTLIRRMPYDRPNTAMDVFPLCAECSAEYDNPADRRFHAQPNACPECGPRVWLTDREGRKLSADAAAIDLAVRQLLAGDIVAIKGLGGFHLACDATNPAAVAKLRQRKRRPSKPLAVMIPDIHWLRRCAEPVSDALIDLLRSPAAPIVLIPQPWMPTAFASGTGVLPSNPLSGADTARPVLPCDAMPGQALCSLIAPGLHEIGVMLPSNPLQHMLLQGVRRPLVMTSGNLNGRPPALDNDRALADLADIADCWLLHDRDILQRADDSLVRLSGDNVEMLRRSRGYVPDAVLLPPGFEHCRPVLAMGSDLKNTFCLLRDGQAILGQHLGDLADEGIRGQQQQALSLFSAIWNFTPAIIAVDAHPGYLSRRWGETLAEELQLPCVATLHHHAHIVACLAEHGWRRDAGPVIGLALDGLGFGGVRAGNPANQSSDQRDDDPGALWGGECLKVDYLSCQWLGGLPAVPLPGGDMAARQPWRNLLAQWLRFVPGWRDLPEVAAIPPAQGEPLARAVAQGINAPEASSTGRLFDAVAAALGLCPREISWEGEAACRLEALAWQAVSPRMERIPVSMPLLGNRLDLALFWRQWLAWQAEPHLRAYGFHLVLAQGFAALARQAARREGIDTIALSGGVLHNRLFKQLLLQELAGMRVLAPSRLPAGDGGLALGQALIAAAGAV
ncbi:carbamoyltransferase HypF [Sodalis sp. dw_96]|uniref:carbamoyltransferase HypF n=1 Tax=Sodalis sp. dw_96 TaxID=2719794 RepID=UPI001BD47380|nr:carbamoyltransferase HypF [Sodalis sp. dw_96]